MTLDKIIQGLKAVRTIHNGNYSTQIDSAIHILKHLKTELEPCEDCISREKLFEQISCWVNSGEYRYTNATYYLTRRIQGMSSVKPQQETGKWLDKKMTIKGAHGMAYGRYACSVCKKKFPNKSNYCPDCGAEMEGEE